MVNEPSRFELLRFDRSWELTSERLVHHSNNECDGTQGLPHSRGTVLPRHQKEERLEINSGKTNATYSYELVTANAQTKKNCNRRTTLEHSVEKKQNMTKHAYLNLQKISPPKTENFHR